MGDARMIAALGVDPDTGSTEALWEALEAKVPDRLKADCSKICTRVIDQFCAITPALMMDMWRHDFIAVLEHCEVPKTWVGTVEALTGRKFKTESSVPPSADLSVPQTQGSLEEQRTPLPPTNPCGHNVPHFPSVNKYGQFLKQSNSTHLLKMEKAELMALIIETRFPLKDPLAKNDKKRLVDFAWSTCFQQTGFTGCCSDVIGILADQLYEVAKFPVGPSFEKSIRWLFQNRRRPSASVRTPLAHISDLQLYRISQLSHPGDV